jgi:predicted Zn-dependent protease with MMP-like domain
MDKEKFENLVALAVETLPQEFQEKLTNIDIVVEDAPSHEQLRRSNVGKGYTLLGLYQGVPLTQRHSSYGMVPPDKITIFQKTIEAKCRGGDENEIKTEIGKVVRHEIAHHFGTGEARLREIEKGES